MQGPNAWTGPRPGYFEYANLWDARWYQIIWIGGYPRDLPITDAGQVGENAWAFLPVYPVLVGAAHLARACRGTRRPSSSRSLAGLGAALVLHRLMSRFLEPDRALFAVVLFCVAPVSPIMQFGYAESARIPVARARAAAARRPTIRMARARARGVGVHPSRGARLRPHARVALDLAVVAPGARSVPDARAGGRGIRHRLRGRRRIRVAGHRCGS